MHQSKVSPSVFPSRTQMDVAMATVNAMVMGFGSRACDVTVVIGPSVGACCFTLEREQAADFYSIHPDCVPDMAETRPHVNIRLATRLVWPTIQHIDK